MCHRHWKKEWGGHAHHKHNRWGRHFASRWFQPPANVLETAEGYQLSIIAPGRTKEDFSISIKDDVLTVSVKKPETSEQGADVNWRRKEYVLSSFERHFQLNAKIDTENINANYTNGIIEVTLPKVPGADDPDKEIMIA